MSSLKYNKCFIHVPSWVSWDHVTDIVDVNTNTTTMLFLIVEYMTLKLKVKQKLA